MKTLVQNFPAQLTEAIAIGKAAKLKPATTEIRNVLICGLGGSGIGGSIVTELVAASANVPINVCKGYFIPAYVGENTLVIISSYSGNTEETLNCMDLAGKKNARIVVITSGGKAAELAGANGYDCIIVPGGMPPRSCLGYSLTQLFFVLSHFNIVTSSCISQLEASVDLLNAEQKNIIAEAEKVARALQSKIPVIYATTLNEGVAIRFRQQLNENAKILCWHHAIPEMNHNELVGWTRKNEDLGVIFLLDKDEYSRNLARVEINKQVISKYAASITDIYSKGNSVIEKAIYFIHIGDWISVLLGELRGADLMEVNVINHLKAKLSEI
jgi:glucose/mannose-6-phosphate isomerase